MANLNVLSSLSLSPLAPKTTAAPAPTLAAEPVAVPADSLVIGSQVYSNVRELTAGLTAEAAAKLTSNNGIDEIFFTDAVSGKSYVAIAEEGSFANVRAGYLGRYNGARVEVKAVEDESNTFREGLVSTWTWAGSVLSNTFGTEASKSLSTVATTAVGSFVAAAALKETAQATPSLLKGGIQGFLGAMKGAAVNFMRTLGSLAITGVAVVGAVSLINGLRAQAKRSDFTTIDMVTGKF